MTEAALSTHYRDPGVETVRRVAVRSRDAGVITSEQAILLVQAALDEWATTP